MTGTDAILGLAELRAVVAEMLAAIRVRYAQRAGQHSISATTMAAIYGMEGERYRRYERAEVLIPLDRARHVCLVTRTSLDTLLAMPTFLTPAEARVACGSSRRLHALALECMLADPAHDLSRLCDADPEKVEAWLEAKAVPCVAAMTVLCKRLGLTLDWIYTGDTTGLPPDMAIRLAAALDNRRLASHPAGPGETGGAASRRASGEPRAAAFELRPQERRRAVGRKIPG